MARYMVVAHQTATSPELVARLRDIAERDRKARFTLVVPETHVSHLLVHDITETHAAAQAAADAAERVLRDARITLDLVTIGDASPVVAIEDVLRADPDYDAVVLSTLRPGVSRWLDMDVHHRVEKKFDLPVIHVCEGGDEAWFGRGAPAAVVSIPPPRRERAPEKAPRLVPERASRWPIVVALMFVYLSITTGLALGVSRTFFITDAVALAVFAVMIVGVRWMERARRMS